jgi:TrwC relaxase/AAA domain
VIGFKQIAGGSAAGVSGMTRHLLTQTLAPEQSRMAEYYAKGAVKDPLMLDVAHAIAANKVTWAEGTEIVVEEMMKAIPEPTAAEQEKYVVWDTDHWITTSDLYAEREEKRLEIEGKVSYRLDALAERIERGCDPPIAVLRPDIHPRVLAGLGIESDGLLSNPEINALLAGLRADGKPIEGKTYVRERRLPVDSRHRERKWSMPTGAYDFCPTPDKSVSVAWGFAPPVEQAQIFNCHIEAAREAVGYIADQIGRARFGHAGMGGTEPGDVAWLEFTHHTTRRTARYVDGDGVIQVVAEKGKGLSGDPDLHTHFLIPNAVFCDSGRVGSLDTRAATHGFIFEADAFYHARLGQKLREAGFDVHLDERTGAARMAVIPQEVCDLFSKRRVAGEALARKFTADRGENWDDLSEKQRETRIENATQSRQQRSLGDKDDVADFDGWKRQAKEIGWEVPLSLQFVGPTLPPLTPEQRHRKAYETGLPWLAEKLEHRSVLKHFDLHVAAFRGLVETGLDGLSDLKGVTTLMKQEGVLQNGERTAIQWGMEDGKRHASVTTILHERDEQEFVRLGIGASRDRSGAIPAHLLELKMQQSGMDFTGEHGLQQAAALQTVGTGGRFSVVIGVPGAGKSALLSPLVSSWNEMGRDVWGASIAWRQADDLEKAGIDKRNLKAFSVLMDGIKDGSIKLTDKSVVAVDEWGLLGTRQGLELLRMRERYGFTVVSLGDEKQIGSITAGSIFELSHRVFGKDIYGNPNIPQITETKRQKTAFEKEFVGLLREGRAADALDMLRAAGRADMAYGGREGTVRKVAEVYAERLRETGKAPTISTPTNSDAHQIGEAVRLERRRMGLVGPDLYRLKATDGDRDYLLPLAKGDRVRLFRSTKADFGDGKRPHSIGRNGSVVEVLNVSGQGIRLHAEDGREGFVRWKEMAGTEGRTMLAYGYASTNHTSQGSTANGHIFAMPGGSSSVSGSAGYTALTRHEEWVRLVTSEVAERIAVHESRPINDTHQITPDDKWAHVAKNLIVQQKSDSALDMLGKVHQLQRGAVKTFHHAARPDDPRRPNGHAADLVHRMKLDRMMERITRGIEHVREAYQRTVGQSPYQGISR